MGIERDGGGRTVGSGDIDALELGVALLGSGGGGTPAPMAAHLRSVLRDRPVEVLSAEELPADALVIPVGVMGSTTILQERLPSGAELSRAVRAMLRWTGSTPSGVCMIEGGGLNGISPLLAAAGLGLPFVDVDLSGRALPRLDQFTLCAAGLGLAPCALAGPGGFVTVIDDVDPPAMEDIARSLTVPSGGWNALAVRPLDAETMRRATIPGSLARALELGRVMLGRDQDEEPAALASALGGRLLAKGRVLAAERHSQSGAFGRTSFVIRDERRDAIVRVEAENEYLAVVVDGEMVSTCPDIIAVVDSRTHALVDTDTMRMGLSVFVVGLPAAPWWAADAARAASVGPRAFGIDHDPVLWGRP